MTDATADQTIIVGAGIIGAAIGFSSWFFLSAVGNYFKKHEGEDIMEVVKSVKESK